jgi:hypothetical protein
MRPKRASDDDEEVMNPYDDRTSDATLMNHPYDER